MTDYIYDLETYPNCFSVVIGNADTRKCRTFEISFRKDQREELFEYLRMIYKTKGRMVGFNNIGFDYPVLHFLLKNQDATANRIYHKAMEIINADQDEKFAHLIWEKDWLIPQIDLFKIHHFDNKARMTSLKMLEFNMRSDNIEDLPFPVGKELTSEQIDILLKYNKHDMLQTFLFYEKSKEQIAFREELTKKYGKNFLNHNDTKIGKDYFIMKLEEKMPGCCFGKDRKPRQTVRKSINLGECIFPYVKFERPEFQAILEWFKQQTIKETKGVFTDILESDLGEVAKYAKMRTKRKKLFKKPTDTQIEKYKKEKPLCWISEETLKTGKVSYWLNWNVADSLNVMVNGLEYVFGVGGLHMSIESSVVKSDDDYIINDQDVASYYPNLAIKNRVYPEHLSESFCDIYEDVYNQRKSFAKGTTENAMMKLALNGVYGDSNNQYSPFYDPKYTMSITINGQLSLCMLAEQLLKIESLSMIQCNTDGLTYKVAREDYQKALDVCKWWESVTKLELEGVDYKAMYIRDVNNYISETFEGKLKNKGAYQWKDLGYHQNHSALVIPMAAEAHLVYGKDIEDFIKKHDNKWDFMLRTKIPRSSKLVLVDDFQVDNPLQNICRYYISKNGGELVKIMPPVNETRTVRIYVDEEGVEYKAYNKTDIQKYEKIPKTSRGKRYAFVREVEEKCEDRRIGINTDWKVTPCNDIKDYKGDIDYDYYVQEVKKLVDL